jgi:PII-like signaling protein
VNEDCLKLTTYFGERDRTADGLLGEALLDLYAATCVPSSIMLRGAEGFGELHQLRTDRLLSLSADLPVVSIAVGSRERIESLLGPVLEVTRKGMITLERVRLLSGEDGPIDVPPRLPEAAKLTVHVGRRERAGGMPAYIAVCELLHRRGIAGASVLLGVDGTRRGRRERATFFARNAEVPMMIVAVGAGDRIARSLPELGELLHRPLLTLEAVRICKRDGELLAPPPSLPATDEHGLGIWQKLTVYTSQGARHDGKPLNLEIIRRLRRSGAAGATTVHGLWGFHGDHAPHGDRVLALRRHVPAVTVTVNPPARTAECFRIIDELTAQEGLVTSEIVPAMHALSAERTVGGLTPAVYEY